MDDEPEMRKALHRLLRSLGFRAEECACAEDEAMNRRVVARVLQNKGITGL